MIAYLNGKIVYKGKGFIILDVNGVGYKVFVLPKILGLINIGDNKEFYIFQQLKEDASDLYGFLNYLELEFFEQLTTSVSGIGPRKSMSIMSTGVLAQVKAAIVNRKLDFLTSVPGIGKKVAEKICFGLKDKLGECEFDKSQEKQDLADSLVGLGYKQCDLGEVLKKVDGKLALQEQIREALKYLGR